MEINLPENERALWLLKTKGPQSLIDLATDLAVTTEGARFQLSKLATEGLAEASTLSKGRGRPQQIWSLTSVGHQRFPDTHAALTVKMIHHIRTILGEAALQAVIDANGKEGAAKYAAALKGAGTLEERVKRLASIRDSEGYMAGYQKEGDGFLLIENHCPICAAAQTCQGFCQSELNTFQTVLGENATVERTDHLLAGARRCAYRISE